MTQAELMPTKEAWERHQRIISNRLQIQKSFLEMGEDLYWIEEKKLYKKLDYETFNAYIASPEVDLRRNTVFQLKRVYRVWLLEQKVRPVVLLDAGYSKADMVAPYVENEKPEFLLSQASSLSRSDLKIWIREKFQEAPAVDAAKDIEIAEFVLGDARHWEPPAGTSLILTDPPYGIQYISGFRHIPHKPIFGDNGDFIQLWHKAFKRILDIANSDCHILMFTTWRTEILAHRVMEQLKLEVKSSIIWVKNNTSMGDLEHSFAPKHERIIHATRGNARMRFREADVIEADRVPTKRHPTEKPVDLLRQLIRATTDEGQLVVDPFAGVGSTLVAAALEQRKYAGVELDEAYHAYGKLDLEKIDERVAQERMALEQLPVFQEDRVGNS